MQSNNENPPSRVLLIVVYAGSVVAMGGMFVLIASRAGYFDSGSKLGSTDHLETVSYSQIDEFYFTDAELEERKRLAQKGDVNAVFQVYCYYQYFEPENRELLVKWALRAENSGVSDATRVLDNLGVQRGVVNSVTEIKADGGNTERE